jgi:hypothetical protein
VVGEFVALLRKERLPDAFPRAWGANVTVNGTFCPAGIVTGKEIPLSEKPDPFQFAVETVTLEEVALSVPLWFWLLPTVTLAKFILAGLTASCMVPAGTGDDAVLAVFVAAQPTLNTVAKISAVFQLLRLGLNPLLA